MNKALDRHCLSYLPGFFLLPFLTLITANAATVSWDGGGGNNSWQTAANWSGNVLPGPNDDVVIDVAGDITVVFSSGSTSIRSLQCQEGFQLTGGTLTVTAGASVINGPLRLAAGSLVVHGPGTTWTANGATTNETANLTAETGGRLTLPSIQRVARTVGGDWILTARGSNSVIDLPNLTQVSVADFYQFTLQAMDGGHIQLPALTQVNALDAYSDGPGSVVDLSGLPAALRNTTAGSSSLVVIRSGSILIPNVTALDHIDVTLNGNGFITLAQLTGFTGATLNLYGATNSLPGIVDAEAANFLVDQAASLTLSGVTQLTRFTAGDVRLTARNGSTLALPNVQSAQTTNFYQLELTAQSGGRVLLPRLSALVGGIIVLAEGTGSSVDLSSFTGPLINTSAGAASLEARAGGAILMAKVTRLHRVDLVIQDNGQVDTAQLLAFTDAKLTLDHLTGNFPLLANVNGSGITLLNGAQLALPLVTQLVRTNNGSITFSVGGPGGLLNLPNVTSATVLPSYQLELFAQDGGRIQMPGLLNLSGLLGVLAQGTNSVVDLSGLHGVLGQNNTGRSSIDVSSGAAVLIPNVTGLNQFTLTIEGTAQIPTAQFTVLTRSTVSIDGTTVILLNLSDTTGTTFTYANGGVAVFQPPADLIITDIRAPATITALQPMSLSWEVTNLGTAVTNSTWSDAVYLSSDTAPGNDILIGILPAGGSLAGGAARRFTNTVVFPAHRAGSWHLGMAVNQSRTVFEGTNYYNNTNIAAATIQIQAPDLIVSTLALQTNAAQFGQTLSLTWTVRNAGAALTTQNWMDRVLLTTNASQLAGAITLLNRPATEVLDANGSYTRTESVALPLFATARSGPYFVVVVTDAGNVIAEAVETNNTANAAIALTLPPLPDLAPTLLSGPTNALPGHPVSLSWIVTNQGTALAAGVWTEVVYVAPTNSGAARLPLASFVMTNPLAISSFATRTQQVVLPMDAPALPSRFIVEVDADQAVAESNETNNTRSALQVVTIPAVLTLQLPVNAIAEANPPPNLQGLITRNGSTAASLVVSLTSSDTSELTSPATVTIPAGKSAAPFTLTVHQDGVPRRDQLVTVSATAAGYGSASAAVTVLNSDPSQLSVQLAATTVIEGGQVAGTVSRSGPTDAAAMVHLAPVGHQRFLLPDQVIIPAGATSTNFILLAQDDTQLQPQGFYTMTATAAGFVSGSAGLLITDNDLAEFTLSFTLTNLAENAGPNAALGTISRGAPSPRSLEIDLQSSTPGVVSLPARVVIASGQSAVSFGVTPVNNTATDGTRTTEIRAFALATQSGERLVPSNPVTLTVADDDGPALSLTPAKKLVAEGLPAATTITVSLSLVTNQPVTVHLASSLPAAATVPATVLVPAGQQNASFALTTLNDQASEGNREVVISATANGFVGGSTAITISDLGLPDLVVEELNGPEAGESEAFVNVSYRVANRGFAPAGTNWTTRLYLSDDPLPGNDIYLTDYAFNGTLPVGEFFGQARQIRLPQAAGDYWLVVVTDIAEQIDEALENNNVSVAARPIHVVPAYQATVSSDLESAPAGTPVPLHGLATRTSTGGPAPFVLVNLHIYLRGTKRIISALTDSTGHFATTFTPLPGEAGFYEIGAAHPGVATASIQDSFTLFGLKAAVASSPLTLVEGATATGQIAFVNLGELPLHGLAVSVFAQPANMTATATLNGSAMLGGFETNSFNFSITAQDASITSGTVTFRLTTTEGAQLDVPVRVAVEALRARLMALPESLEAGMKVGGQAFVQFDIANVGGLTSEPVHIALPSLPWLRVITPNPLPGLAPGETNHVTLQLTPAADMNLGAYNGWLGINAGNAGTTLPFIFRALSEAKGDLLVTAVDEYTYFAEGSPKVAGASVTVRDAVTGQIVTNGVTGPDGQFFAGQLEEAYYAIELRADKHRAYRSTQLLGAGKTNEVLAFMGREAVQLIWTVTPTEIQDRTRITIETIFEAYVPMPVVTVDPPLIDLHDFTADVTQIDLRISNHGLIAAQDAKLNFGTHPDWSFEPLIHDLGDLPARSTLTIPLLIRRTHASAQGAAAFAAASGGGPCTISGSVSWKVICGGGAKGSGIPIPIINASATGNCGGGGLMGGGGEGGPTGGGGGGGGGGGSSASSPGSCDPCLLGIAKAIANCVLKFVLSDALKCAKDSYGCASGLSGHPTGGTAYTCFKAILNCLKAMGKSIPGSSLLKFPECAYGLLTACDGAPSSGGGGGNHFNSAYPSPSFLAAPGALPFSAAAVGGGVGGFNPLRPELRPLVPMLPRVEKFLDPALYVMGDSAWLQVVDHDAYDRWMDAFLATIEPATDGGSKVSATERAQLLALALPAPVTAAKAGQFIDRWNRTFDYWNAGIFTVAQVPPGQSTDFLATDTWSTLANTALGAIAESEAEHAPDPISAVSQYARDLEHFLSEGEGGGVCAHVRLRLDQEAIVTRDAFSAALEIENETDGALGNISVELAVRRRSGEDATAFFAIFPPDLNGITAVDGTGVVAPNATGKATWTIVPTTDAVGTNSEDFLVSGVLHYQDGTLPVTVPLAPSLITVFPSASLAVKYFHQRDVMADDPFTTEIEPSIPYSLAVMVQNNGHGAARDVRIVSAQPRIVENEKGLYADFRIIATEVAGQNLQPSLTVEFGRIDPGTNAIGRWLFVSSILGGFIDYSATFEHLDGLENKSLSLIEGVEIHELIHIVQAPAPFNDGRPDFLVNDVADLYDVPDTLHLSDGTVAPVSAISQATFNRAPTTNNLVVQMTAPLPAGWAYLSVTDPGTNQFRLVRVVRSDGVEIRLDDNVWTTDRTFLGNARRPLHQNLLHLFDLNSTGSYTLYYTNLPPGDVVAPASLVGPLPSDSSPNIPVNWSGEDNAGGSGISFFDIYVSIDSAPFIQWQRETLDRSAVFQGQFGHTYRFYSVATDVAGNREAVPFTPDAQTTVTRSNRPPVIAALADQIVREGQTLSVQVLASDPDGDELIFSLAPNAPAGVAIHPYTGLLSWVTGEGNGPSVTAVTVQVLDNGSPRLGTVRTFQVTVVDDNSAPVLAPIANYAINEGRLLLITNFAQDFDLPGQTLTFSLGAGAAAGATLDPVSGVFQWRPTEFQGGTTNRFSIVVQDSGSPVMTATQSFSVVVRDTQTDFIVGVGTTNVLAGSSNAVPIYLTSGADLDHIIFELAATDAHLAGMDLRSLAAELTSASFEPTASGLYRLRMEFDPGRLQSGSRALAWLNFETQPAGHSSIAKLHLDALTGARTEGEPLTHGNALDGRIFIIEHEPLLGMQVSGPGQGHLTVYGLPGHRYRIRSQAGLGTNDGWSDGPVVNLDSTYQALDLPVTGEPVRFFEVREEP